MTVNASLLDEVDRYLDVVPRSDADAETVGPFTLFVGRGEWSYYARPRRGLSEPVSIDDVRALGAHCAKRGVDLGIEWIGELTPTLEPAAREMGLVVEQHALMTLAPADLDTVDPPDAITVELLHGADRRLDDARAVAAVSFRAGGTSVGSQGPEQRDEAVRSLSQAMRAHLAQRSERELTLTVIATGPEGVLAAGSLQPAGKAGEVLAVATLPSARRQGLAAAVTSALVREALNRRLDLVLLSAQSDDVARVYEQVGFRRVGTHLAAETHEP